MSLQDAFYIVGIIAMVFHVVIISAVGVFLFIAVKKINSLLVSTEEKIERAKGLVDDVEELGTVMAGKAIGKVSSILKKND